MESIFTQTAVPTVPTPVLPTPARERGVRASWCGYPPLSGGNQSHGNRPTGRLIVAGVRAAITGEVCPAPAHSALGASLLDGTTSPTSTTLTEGTNVTNRTNGKVTVFDAASIATDQGMHPTRSGSRSWSPPV